jgi:hypothetical protein
MIQRKTRVTGGPLRGEGVVIDLALPEDQGSDPDDPVLMVEETPRGFFGWLFGHGTWYAIPRSRLREIV